MSSQQIKTENNNSMYTLPLLGKVSQINSNKHTQYEHTQEKRRSDKIKFEKK